MFTSMLTYLSRGSYKEDIASWSRCRQGESHDATLSVYSQPVVRSHEVVNTEKGGGGWSG